MGNEQERGPNLLEYAIVLIMVFGATMLGLVALALPKSAKDKVKAFASSLASEFDKKSSEG